MQINSANSSQAVSSPSPDENPNQSLSVSRVTAVANSAEAITTASTSCAAQSSQEPAVSQTSSMTELGLTPDELDNLLDLNMTIDDNFDFDFDFDILDTEETETAPSGANLPNTASLAPVQEEPTEPSQSESTQDERPSTSAAPPQNVALTSTETSFPTLAQLLTTSPLNNSAELAASDRQLAVASASQMRVDRGTARARRRDASAPIPRRREVLTRLEQEQIVDYSYRHCSGFSLRAAVDFMNSRPEEAFGGILTSSGQAYTYLPFSSFQEMLRRIKGSMTHIP